jgi:hypothetical protein
MKLIALTLLPHSSHHIFCVCTCLLIATINLISFYLFFLLFHSHPQLGENPAELLRDYGIAISPSTTLMLSLLLTIVTYQIFCLCSL